MLNIIKRLDRELFEPTVCVSRVGGRLDEVVRNMGIPLIEAPTTIPPKPYASLLCRASTAAQVFRPYHFDLWHSFHYASDYTEPIIARLSGARAWVFTKKNMGWGDRAWKLRSFLASGIAAQNTDMLSDFFSSAWLHRKTRLVPRGVDVKRFHPQAAPVLGLRNTLGIPPLSPVIACVAHMVPVKGHPTLLQAFYMLSHQPLAHLWLAGKAADAAYTEELCNMVNDLGLREQVHFLGEVENIPALLAETDIFCLPTWERWRMEGSPVAMLEAMACGKACVGSDIPGIRDQVGNEQSGLLVPPENPQALSTALQRLIDDPQYRLKLGQAARQIAEQDFNIDLETRRHEKMYLDLMRIST